ncbi:hypothetical protein ACFTWM_03045 [Streptomyces bacillaris]|uniref:hypothetical protein n=1 Tax=Streptomyces bacillaris TaxID=68179 RepID=UPI00362E083C
MTTHGPDRSASARAFDACELHALELIRTAHDLDLVTAARDTALDSLHQRYGTPENENTAYLAGATAQRSAVFLQVATHFGADDNAAILKALRQHTRTSGATPLHTYTYEVAVELIDFAAHRVTEDNPFSKDFTILWYQLLSLHGPDAQAFLPVALATLGRFLAPLAATARSHPLDEYLNMCERGAMDTHEYERECWEMGFDPYE